MGLGPFKYFSCASWHDVKLSVEGTGGKHLFQGSRVLTLQECLWLLQCWASGVSSYPCIHCVPLGSHFLVKSSPWHPEGRLSSSSRKWISVKLFWHDTRVPSLPWGIQWAMAVPSHLDQPWEEGSSFLGALPQPRSNGCCIFTLPTFFRLLFASYYQLIPHHSKPLLWVLFY